MRHDKARIVPLKAPRDAKIGKAAEDLPQSKSWLHPVRGSLKIREVSRTTPALWRFVTEVSRNPAHSSIFCRPKHAKIRRTIAVSSKTLWCLPRISWARSEPDWHSCQAFYWCRPRFISVKNQVRRSVSSIQTSIRLAVATSRCSSHTLCASRSRAASVWLSSASSAVMSAGST
jgi:hypothetical protein